ncbi:hypothetical protein OH76DRAFT_1482024 [Lentinus brumalis]|uniref:Uncharacterized protein n=1 Tax=Lentinus brumalis TaxID=2498619 RepID=A0A371DEN2_9APHY|nr:hypothetical protein OH76DRAFT_1482024 [Polyporus brumalis]
MSRPYSVDHSVFVRDLWPGGIGKLQGNTEHDHLAPLWTTITPSFDALCTFITVDPLEVPYSDPARRHVVRYQPELEAPTETFSIKVQGFLKDFHMDPLGNWGGKENTAFKATRSIVLDSGGCDGPFNMQKDVLNMIKEVIVHSLDHAVLDVPVDSRPGIHLRSNVFTQIRSNSPVVSSSIHARDDPRGFAAKIARRWAVTSTIKMRAPATTGARLLPATRVQFRSGDFVEVKVVPDIVTTFQNRHLRVDVRFIPISITRLCTAAEAKARANITLASHLLPQSSSPIQPSTSQSVTATTTATPQEWQQMIRDSYFPPVPPPSAVDRAENGLI